MKKYGIRTTENDSTPGFRSRDVTVTWFTSETERNQRYENLTKPRTYDLRDMMFDDGYITSSYEKVEE
ncbi:hypothetical protein [Yersinia pseudotuberculosis]|uniref:hypothetical protein n=1 Tax=Yersinia pseudotuberculosis TaxID=633 RepID=UPI0005DD1C84|nr:hypothetical protein [Yersinia pseudotuberculosis]CND40642.1 Uncharacterised protein [Yersinia pseudotuberculosis]